jgi:hypothetical protein
MSSFAEDGWGAWDANAKVRVRRDMNIGGSRVDVTALRWDGDKLVFTGDVINCLGLLRSAEPLIFGRRIDRTTDLLAE